LRRAIIVAGCFVFFLSIVGCQSMGQKTKTGALVGAVSGAGLGGIIGHQSGHGGEGAAIGAAVGALTGGLIGNQMDKNAQQTETVSTVTTNNAQGMTLQEIVELNKQGINDDVVVDRLRLTNTKIQLSDSDIAYLRQNKVSEKVIAELRK